MIEKILEDLKSPQFKQTMINVGISFVAASIAEVLFKNKDRNLTAKLVLIGIETMILNKLSQKQN